MSGGPQNGALPGRSFILGLYALVALVCIGLLAGKGLNYGIDFTGGTLLERRFQRAVSVEEIRTLIEGPELAGLELSGAVVQATDDARDVIIRVRPLTAGEIEQFDAALASAFGEAEILRTEVIGPVIGEELVRRALLALVLSAVGVLIYLSFRFEFKYGAVAVAAVLHDALVVLGLVSLLQLEINTPFIAAILTVIGYSLNDTIVVFDRVRELFRFRKREPVAELVGRAVRQTLTRSVNTSVTTLMTSLALLFFGGSTIRDFALVLSAGVAAGTLSSILFASHLWAAWKEREESGGGARGEVGMAAE